MTERESLHVANRPPFVTEQVFYFCFVRGVDGANYAAYIVAMSNALIPALQSELAILETDIRQNPDPRLRKADRIRELLREYGAAVHTPPDLTPLERAITGSGSAGRERPPLPMIPVGKQVSKQERIRRAIRDLLAKQQIAHRKDILANLIEIGLMGHEKDSMQQLAQYLSRFKEDFVFDGNGNYSLRPS